MPRNKKQKQDEGIGGLMRMLIEVVLAVMVIRIFLFQPFYIPSGSMQPTLLVGDYVFVSKYAYGYSRYSQPFWSLNLFSGRIWGAEPKRGDIVVFRPTGVDQENYFIKRIIGLPGDTIEMRSGALYLNGEAVQREKIGETGSVDMIGDLPAFEEGFPSYRIKGGHRFNPAVDAPVTVYRETLPNGVSYNTFDIYQGTKGDDISPVTVAPGHYFMMGDNRDNSEDSRFAALSQVPEENLIGRANLRFFSIRNDMAAWKIWRWPSDVRWGRLFTSVQSIQDVPVQ